MQQLTNEQKALRQIITYMHPHKEKQLNFYLQVVDSNAFLNHRYARIFETLKYLALNKPISQAFESIKTPEDIINEVLTYLQAYHANDNFTENELAFLNSPQDETENNLEFLDLLKHTYSQEKLFQQFLNFIRPSYDRKDPYQQDLFYRDVFDKVRKFMSLIPNQADKNLLTIKEMMALRPESFAVDEQAKQKILTEYYRFSRTFSGLGIATNGFRKKQLITIGGDTGLGKTTFTYNLLLDISQVKYQEERRYPHIVVFSYEMTPAENLDRFLATISQIPLNTIWSKDFQYSEITKEHYQERMEVAKEILSNINLSFMYDKSKCVDNVIDLTHRLRLEQKVDIIVIDYLQFMKSLNHLTDSRLAIDEIIEKLKSLAVELDIAVIVLSQYSRAHNTHGNSPAITALKGSSGIEQNSDIVLLMSEFKPRINKKKLKPMELYADGTCEELYFSVINGEGEKYEHVSDETIVELAIKKNRSGTKDKTFLYHFAKKTQTFKEVGDVKPYNYEDY